MQITTRPAVTSYTFFGVALALSAIHQGGDSTGGTIDVLHREKMLTIDGEVVSVPTITGNGVRGILRRCGMKAMLAQLGNPILSVGAFHFLTSGGSLTKEAGRGLDIDEERKLRELIPLASIFGGATGRRILRGKLKVGKWLPICSELRHLLPEQHQDLPHAQQSVMEMTDLASNSRMDESKNNLWQQSLPEAQHELLAAPKTRTTKAGEEIAEKPGVAQQMRYSKEVLAMGTQFSCWFRLEDVTDLEFEAFAAMMSAWGQMPFIGGDGREGLGLVALRFDNWEVSVNPNARLSEDAAVAFPVGYAYQEHLQTRGEEIIQYLREMD